MSEDMVVEVTQPHTALKHVKPKIDALGRLIQSKAEFSDAAEFTVIIKTRETEPDEYREINGVTVGLAMQKAFEIIEFLKQKFDAVQKEE